MSGRTKWLLRDFKVEGADAEYAFNWTDPSGCSWDGAVSALAGGIFGFCGCGSNEDALAYVLGGLDLIAALKAEVWQQRRSYAEWDERCREHFGSEGAEYFFWYWCDNEDLTEHGGSVPGWLTERGEAIRADIRSVLDAIPNEQQSERAETTNG